ncbi:RNA-binding KH domain-containing protein [Hibiscus syriacus]|uniref:RNA-binding KH domain-containing protein n=1 Tax=Hibiscus syriacus TaxID=106335 RepID=A0A6A2ZM27_HIBSY|nr:F-box protein At1g30200-like [Hibiscus syriacus]KAE8692928.1 RNA-binding KH domain-containing protein [Hibiscus syriacus]
MCSKGGEAAAACFDCLPDALLILIFNKLHHLKSLTVCLSVSKRFNALVPFTDTVFISIPRLKHSRSISTSHVNTSLRLLFLNLFLKPLRCFHRIMAPHKPKTTSFDLSCCRQNGVLKIFKEMKSLHLELPGDHGETLAGSSNGASFLQWKAGFGTNLKTCVIVGATSFQKSSKKEEREQFMEGTVLNDGELKSRVIWTISCLIAASTRHCLLKRILADNNPNIPLLERVVISDANKQGMFCVGKEELVKMRNSMNLQQESSSSSMERSPVPELNMRLWYLPVLELPESGYVMKGATLVLIRPVVDGMIENDDGDPLVGDEKPFSEAVREMIKVKNSYFMTVSSF